jgi:hypothetical protein
LTHFKFFWDPSGRVAAVSLEPSSAPLPVRHLRVRLRECHQLVAECRVPEPDWNRVGTDSHGRTLGAVPWNLTMWKGLHQYHYPRLRGPRDPLWGVLP